MGSCDVYVVGERNSGTNYVAAALRANLRAEPDAHHRRGPQVRVRDGTEPVWVHYLARLASPRTQGFEPVKDVYWRLRPRHLGWKHQDMTARTVAQIQAMHQVRIVGVVRDPFAWAVSSHRSPFHLGRVGAPAGQSLSDFVRTVPPAMQREHRNVSVNDMWHLWSHKAAGLAGIEDAWNVVVVRYEDVALDAQATLAQALRPWTLPLATRERWTQVHGTARPWQRTPVPDDRTGTDFARAVRERAWMRHFTDDDLAFAAASLDPAVMQHYGYAFPA